MSTKNELARGSVEMIILRLLQDKPMYGYEMIKVVYERTNGYFEWKEGSLYPCLHRLEGDGLIVSSSVEYNGKIRKYYSLSLKGKRAAEEQIEEGRKFCHAVTLLLSPCEA